MSAAWFPKDVRLKEASFPGGGKDSLNIVITLTQMDFFFLVSNPTDQFYPFLNYKKRGRDLKFSDPAVLPTLGHGFLYLKHYAL